MQDAVFVLRQNHLNTEQSKKSPISAYLSLHRLPKSWLTMSELPTAAPQPCQAFSLTIARLRFSTSDAAYIFISSLQTLWANMPKACRRRKYFSARHMNMRRVKQGAALADAHGFGFGADSCRLQLDVRGKEVAAPELKTEMTTDCNRSVRLQQTFRGERTACGAAAD